MTAEILQLLRDLVAFKSLTPDDGGSFNYLQNYLHHLGGVISRVDRNQTTNLIASFGSGATILAFAGHVDVVPSGEASAWHNGEPFQLYVHGEQLIGRGVADMKGSIAAFLVALKEFLRTSAAHEYRILVLLTSDEEGDARDGTPLIVEYLQQQQLQLNYCVVGEPSAVNRLGDTLKVGRRGSLSATLQIIGKQGHIAYPHLAVNPIHLSMPALAELAAVVWDQGSDYFPATSLQFANVTAGLGVSNVIPGHLSCEFNFRYNNLHSAGELQTAVTQLLERHNLTYTLAWRHSAQPFLTKVAKLVAVAAASIEQICGITPQATTDGGTSDGRFLIAVSDELIELGLRNDSIHQLNEATSISDLEQLSAIYKLILTKIFLTGTPQAVVLHESK